MSKGKEDKIVGMIHGKDAKIIMETRDSGEPIFVLRAKDIFSVLVIREYAKLIAEYGPDETQFLDDIEQRLVEFKKWQREHVGLVRYPD